MYCSLSVFTCPHMSVIKSCWFISFETWVWSGILYVLQKSTMTFFMRLFLSSNYASHVQCSLNVKKIHTAVETQYLKPPWKVTTSHHCVSLTSSGENTGDNILDNTLQSVIFCHAGSEVTRWGFFVFFFPSQFCDSVSYSATAQCNFCCELQMLIKAEKLPTG